jgi:hypothetical protein
MERRPGDRWYFAAVGILIDIFGRNRLTGIASGVLRGVMSCATFQL